MARRADEELARRGLCPSRSQAKQRIAEGKVLCNGKPLTKPSAPVEATDTLTVTGEAYVGRGGLKLAAGLEAFSLSPAGKICLDVGASTGGFTECMLRHGAARVYAVDVGHGQLAPALREDPRVCNREGTDIRTLRALPEVPSFFGVDVSFISLRLVLPAVYALLAPGAHGVVLMKPQFEAGREAVGKGGIVRSETARRAALENVCLAARAAGFTLPVPPIICPVRGGDGNVEYLAHLWKAGE